MIKKSNLSADISSTQLTLSKSEALEALKNDTGFASQADVAKINNIVTGIGIVVGIGFIAIVPACFAIFYDSLSAKNDSYSTLRSENDALTDKIHSLDIELINKSNELENKVRTLDTELQALKTSNQKP